MQVDQPEGRSTWKLNLALTRRKVRRRTAPGQPSCRALMMIITCCASLQAASRRRAQVSESRAPISPSARPLPTAVLHPILASCPRRKKQRRTTAAASGTLLHCHRRQPTVCTCSALLDQCTTSPCSTVAPCGLTTDANKLSRAAAGWRVRPSIATSSKGGPFRRRRWRRKPATLPKAGGHAERAGVPCCGAPVPEY